MTQKTASFHRSSTKICSVEDVLCGESIVWFLYISAITTLTLQCCCVTPILSQADFGDLCVMEKQHILAKGTKSCIPIFYLSARMNVLPPAVLCLLFILVTPLKGLQIKAETLSHCFICQISILKLCLHLYLWRMFRELYLN